MPLALSGNEWLVLLVSVVPAALTVALAIGFWRWAKRSDEAERRGIDDGSGQGG